MYPSLFLVQNGKKKYRKNTENTGMNTGMNLEIYPKVGVDGRKVITVIHTKIN